MLTPIRKVANVAEEIEDYDLVVIVVYRNTQVHDREQGKVIGPELGKKSPWDPPDFPILESWMQSGRFWPFGQHRWSEGPGWLWLRLFGKNRR